MLWSHQILQHVNVFATLFVIYMSVLNRAVLYHTMHESL
jgi:hypothetical protein